MLALSTPAALALYALGLALGIGIGYCLARAHDTYKALQALRGQGPWPKRPTEKR